MPLEIEQLDAEGLRQELAKLERAHEMPSAEFYERYCAGELGDAEDFVYWAGLCAIALQEDGLAVRAHTA